jgi:zinc protease
MDEMRGVRGVRGMRGKRPLWIGLLLVALGGGGEAWGQSGRGRPPAPAPPRPRPAPGSGQPGPAIRTIPEGGKLVGEEVSQTANRYRLQNGLTVIVRERHTAPLIAIQVGVRAGLGEEPEDWPGLAKVTQEAIWQGIAARHQAPVERLVSQLGGQWKREVDTFVASSSMVVPAESYADAISLLAESVPPATIEPEAVATARRLLDLKERARPSSPEQVALARFLSLGLPSSLWARLGRDSLLGQATTIPLEVVNGFYQSAYQPARTVVVVTGDIFSLAALEQIQFRFGTYRGQVPPASPPPSKPNDRSGTSTTELSEPLRPAGGLLQYGNDRLPLGQSRVTIGYRVPLPKSSVSSVTVEKEEATLELLAAVLGRGRASRLAQGLREGLASRDRTSVVSQVHFDYLPFPLVARGEREREAGLGLLVAQLTIDPNRIDRAEAEYFREIERFRREKISPAELQRAQTLLEKAELDAVATLEDEAALLAWGELLEGDYRRRERRRTLRRNVTAQEIQQAAATYLQLTQTIVHELEPPTAAARTFTAERFTDLVTTLVPATAQPILPEEIKPAVVLKTFPQGPARVQGPGGQNVLVASIPLPIRDFSVLRGPRAFVREDKSQPKVTAVILFQGGRLLETTKNSGITELMLRTMLKSSVSRKADLIAHELESYGAEVTIVNEPDFYGFGIEVLSRNAEPAIKLLIEIVEKPFFDTEELARERAILLADQSRSLENRTALTREQLWMSLFPGHPYGLPSLGVETVVKELTVENLEVWHQQTMRRQYPLVILVGDTDGSALVSRIFSDGLRRGDLDQTLRVNLPTSTTASEDRALAIPEETITRQAVGFRVFGSALPGPQDRQVVGLLGEWVSHGPLLDAFQERSDPIGLLAGSFEQRLAAGGFITEVTTFPGAESSALDLLSREFQRLTATPPTDEEFEYARNGAIGHYAIKLQSARERALEYARALFFGRQPAEVEGHPEAVVAIRKSDLIRVAEAIFRTNLSGRGVVRGATPDSKTPSSSATQP